MKAGSVTLRRPNAKYSITHVVEATVESSTYLKMPLEWKRHRAQLYLWAARWSSQQIPIKENTRCHMKFCDS
jgi:hypothetical protein